jgi:hypothetical protein
MEAQAMKRIKVAVHLVPVFFTSFLMSSAPVLGAQTQASGASVAVRMIDPVDSSRDPAGKQYRASVTKAVDAGNGVSIQQGAVAVVMLANDRSGYSAHLASVTINGQTVAITSSAASVTTGAQTAVGSAVHSINSVLGGFGHHVSAPSGVTAIAMGQRVVLPPGTTLSFVLTQPPAANPATPAAPTSQPSPPSGSNSKECEYHATCSGTAAPAGQPMAASTTPAPTAAATSAAPASSLAAASTGGQFIFCYTSAEVGIDTYFTGVFQTTRIKNGPPNGRYHVDQSIPNDFYAYLQQKGYKFKSGGNGGGCVVKRTEADANAAQHATAYGGPGFLGVSCCGYGKVVETGWKE